MKDQILKIISIKPKHFSKIIKNTPELSQWVANNTLLHNNEPFVDLIYSAITQTSNICKNGNIMKFKSINSENWTFCGKAGRCACAAESVSKSVTKAKAKRSKQEILIENEKRVNTNLNKYGVPNAGQTELAIKEHKLFYSNQNNITIALQKQQKTLKAKYGVTNAAHIPGVLDKRKETYMKKYGFNNPVFLSKSKQNPGLNILKNKESLLKYFPKFSVTEIADYLNVHENTVYKHLNHHSLRTPYQSSYEKEIISFLESLGIKNIQSRNRSLISKEIDIYLPDYKLAIEYNGVYYHHDQVPYIDKYYHYNKFIECEQLGIKLLTIFSTTWKTKKNIWKNKIISMLKMQTDKVYARNCNIVIPDITELKNLLNNNHIQGYCNSQINYGLVYNNELIAAMTFSNKRIGIGKKRNSDEYELVRFVTSKLVVGAASKLLNHFIKINSPKLIYSYSDNQYSSGDLYKKLNFKLLKEHKCGYWYYDPKKKISYHRFRFTKFKLIKNGADPNKTEKQIMRENGYLRIYNCGTRSWELEL